MRTHLESCIAKPTLGMRAHLCSDMVASMSDQSAADSAFNARDGCTVRAAVCAGLRILATAARKFLRKMIKFSVTIMRGCFGGCSFCSITEHEGRVIQSRSETSILREIEQIRDRTPGFTGIISDPVVRRQICIGWPAKPRSRGCVQTPFVCIRTSVTTWEPITDRWFGCIAKRGRFPVKRIFVASGVRYDLAVRSPEWIRELAQHHTGGYLKIAPEHTKTDRCPT